VDLARVIKTQFNVTLERDYFIMTHILHS
jgi:hypothetical protein